MRTAIALTMSLVFCGQALASVECRQGHGIYADATGAYQLSFKALDSDAAAADLEFKLDVVKSNLSFNGYVMPFESGSQTNAILFHNCPDGDVTGADLAACTVWEGLLHITPKGTISPLPGSNEQAASDIFLPGIGPSLDKFAREAKALPHAPDIFTLKGCQS